MPYLLWWLHGEARRGYCDGWSVFRACGGSIFLFDYPEVVVVEDENWLVSQLEFPACSGSRCCLSGLGVGSSGLFGVGATLFSLPAVR